MDDLDAMTGLGDGAPRGMVLNILSLNGDAEIVETDGEYKTKGGFYRLLKIKGAPKGEKPEEERLGDKVNVVFLKIRRVLQQRSSDGELVKWTNEHSTPDNVVELHTKNVQGVEVGAARALREKYGELRTIQYVYGLLFRDMTSEPELVKIKFRGSALGSEAKDKDVMSFYDYIYADRKDAEGNKEHLRHFITELGAVKEVGKKTYFTVTFTQGAKLDETLCTLADQTLREVHEKVKSLDEAVARRIASSKQGAETVAAPVADDIQTIDYPDATGEGIDPKDIPF